MATKKDKESTKDVQAQLDDLIHRRGEIYADIMREANKRETLLEKKIAGIEKDLCEIEKMRKALAIERAATEQDRKDWKKQQTSELHAMKVQVDDLQKKKEEVNTLLDALDAKKKDLEREGDRIGRITTDLHKAQEGFTSRVSALEQEREVLLKKVEEFEAKREVWEADNASKQRMIESREAQIAEDRKNLIERSGHLDLRQLELEAVAEKLAIAAKKYNLQEEIEILRRKR